MDNGIGHLPPLLTFWRRLGAWVDRRGPKEGLTAQIFFTSSAIFGTLLCFGFRPVLVGFYDWLRWRLPPKRATSGAAPIRTLPQPTSASAPATTAW